MESTLNSRAGWARTIACVLLVFAAWVAAVSTVRAQTLTFGNYDAHGRPRTLQVDTDITLTIGYTPRGAIASVTDGQARVDVTRNAVGRVTKITANGWLIIDFEYETRGRAKRIYDNFGNELAFVRSATGVRDDVFRHANASKLSGEYLKTVDPLVLSGLSTEPAVFAMALYSLALLERADLAGLSPSFLPESGKRLAQVSLLESVLDKLISPAHAQPAPNCPARTYLALRAWVAVACKSGSPSQCLPSDSCFQNTVKIARRSNCITARKTINRKCFNGGDPGHQQQVEQEINGIKECLRVRPICCKSEEE